MLSLIHTTKDEDTLKSKKLIYIVVSHVALPSLHKQAGLQNTNVQIHEWLHNSLNQNSLEETTYSFSGKIFTGTDMCILIRKEIQSLLTSYKITISIIKSFS